jgi:hypothetical protein
MGTFSSLTTGSNNTAIGDAAGETVATGTQNVVIGSASDTSTAGAVNQIVIGAGAVGVGNNKAQIGNASVTDVYFGDGTALLHGDGSLLTNLPGGPDDDSAYALLAGATFSGAITATNLSGSNTGDQSLAAYALTSSLGTLATQSGTFSGTSSGTNTGDQSLAAYALTSSLGTLATQSGTFSGTSSGTNTGDQTAIGGLTSATTTVVVSAATAPTAGQVLTASSTTAAAWVTPSGGGATTLDGLTDVITNYTTHSMYLGTTSGSTVTVGTDNTSLGDGALQHVTLGAFNTAIGGGAIPARDIGSFNTAVGYRTGYSCFGYARDNTFIGYEAGMSNTSGCYNTIIGDAADVAGYPADSNQVVIGQAAQGRGDRTAQIGNTSITDVYFGTPATTVLHADGSQLVGIASTHVLTTTFDTANYLQLIIGGVTYKVCLAI